MGAMVRFVNRARSAATLGLLVAVLVMFAPTGAAGASATRPADAARTAAVSAPPPNTNVPTPTDNPFIPTKQNLSDCVGTMELPNCGSPKKGDSRTYLTFAVLMLGMGFIGWRIVVSVRRRDRQHVRQPVIRNRCADPADR